MPHGEQFWNPYRLIPIRAEVPRRPPRTHERFSGISGWMSCSIVNLTPLFIGGRSSGSQHPPLLRRNRRVIPGASLKGMLRSLVEIVGGGCFVVRDNASPHANQYNACDNVQRLCVGCRMFGMMERGPNARVHRGNIHIGDALVREEREETIPLEVLLTNNKLRHEPFYRNPATHHLDGNNRKMYFHQPRRVDSTPQIPAPIRDRGWRIDAVRAGHHFDFDLQFTNLAEEELNLLLYVLALEESVSVEIPSEDGPISLSGPMRHKIGNAKPLGLGSSHIQVQKLTFLAEPRHRFGSLSGNSAETVLEGEALHGEIQRRTAQWRNDASPTMEALRKMMVWDEKDPRDFRYPDYNWFQNPQNAQKPLKPI
jgi:hypothetical protein